MLEGSCTVDSTWRERERERAEKELTARWRGLPFKLVEKEVGRGRGPGGRVHVEDGEGGREGGAGSIVGPSG
jgi:hypothetical protein